MRITVQVTVDTPEHTEPVVREVFTLTREALGPDLVGLHLAEAHELLTALQEVLVPTQISEALAQRRRCAHCGRAYRHKDTKKITLRTLFGTLDVAVPAGSAARATAPRAPPSAPWPSTPPPNWSTCRPASPL